MADEQVGSAWYDLGAKDDKLQAALSRADRDLAASGQRAERGFFGSTTRGFNNLSDGVGRSVAKVAAAAARITAIGAGITLALGGFALKGAAEMERYNVQWEVLLGSTEAATKRMDELRRFAATTPFEIPQVIAASRSLQIFGGELLATGDNLRLVGDVAAGVGQPFEDVAMWVGRMYDAIKNGQPFGEAAMRLQEMGAMSGESRRDIENLAAAVADGSMTMEEAWAGVSGEFSAFSGLMEKQAGTLEGQWSNLQDAIGQGAARIGESILPLAKDVLPQVIAGVTELATWVTDTLVPSVADWVEQNQPLLEGLREMGAGLIRGVIDLVGDLAERAGTIAGRIADWVRENGPLLDGLREFASDVMQRGIGLTVDALEAIGSEPVLVALGLAALAVLALNAAIRANPIVAVATTVIAGLGVISKAWDENWLKIRQVSVTAVGILMEASTQILETLAAMGDGFNFAFLVVQASWEVFVGAAQRGAALFLEAMAVLNPSMALVHRTMAAEMHAAADNTLRRQQEIGHQMELIGNHGANGIRTMANGIRANIPAVRAGLQGVWNVPGEFSDDAEVWGYGQGIGYTNALARGIYAGKPAIEAAIYSATGVIRGYSPPREGRLRDIGLWARAIARFYMDQFAAAIGAGRGRVDEALVGIRGAFRDVNALVVTRPPALGGTAPALGLATMYAGATSTTRSLQEIILRVEDPHAGLAAAGVQPSRLEERLSRDLARRIRFSL